MAAETKQVFRAQHDREHPFVRIANSAMQDARLSFRARGVLGYILSKPDSFRHSAESLAKQGTEGREAIERTFTEMKALGYCLRITERDPKTGRIKSRNVFYEQPTTDFQESATDAPDYGISGVGPTTAYRDPENRPPENRLLENRATAFQECIKPLSNNDCNETTVIEPTVEERGVGGNEIVPVAKNALTNPLYPSICVHFAPIAERLTMVEDGVAEAFEHWCRLKATWFQKDGVTASNAHHHFESWLRSTREGKGWMHRKLDHSKGF